MKKATDSFALILMAPPASGKTHLLRDLVRQGQKIVFLSPLKALALEVASRFKNSVYASSRQEFKSLRPAEQKVVITTVEIALGSLDLQFSDHLFVLDEFHLFWLWGEQFRPQLLEIMEEIGGLGLSLLALSASMEPSLLHRSTQWLKEGWDQLLVIDHGNLRPKYYPQMWWCLALNERTWLHFLFHKWSLETDGRSTLVFFHYRAQVKFWVTTLRSAGHSCLGCVGGEVGEFVKDLEKFPTPQFILSTTALSHGVNLPSLKRVVLTYRVESPAFVLQMVTRGGRSGEKYDICSVQERPWPERIQTPSWGTRFKLWLEYRWWKFWEML